MNKRLTEGNKFKPSRRFYCPAMSHFDVACDGGAGAGSGRACTCVRVLVTSQNAYYYTLFGT